MITLQTITTIELSNICNLQCSYCINRLLVRHPARTPGIMSDAVFNTALTLLERLCERGTQAEVNLNGNGESCLDPQLPARAARVKEIMGARTVQLCTNGLNMTPELARELKASGIDRVDLSLHSPYHTRRARAILRAADMPHGINTGPLVASHNWAGQLEDEHRVPIDFIIGCDPLREGRGYIQAEGAITPCCYDYRNLGAFSSVFDDDVLDRPLRRFALCRTCHQQIDPETFAQTGEDHA